MSVSSLIVQTGINSFGTDAVAGMTVYAKLEGFLYLPAFAYGIALTSFVGQNAGAGRIDRIKDSLKISLKTSLIVMVPLIIILVVFAPIFLRCFTDEEGTLYYGIMAVRWVFPFYIFYAFGQCYLGVIKGLGDTIYPMITTLVCYCIFRSVWVKVLLIFVQSMKVVYLSYDISLVLMLIMLVPHYMKRMKE